MLEAFLDLYRDILKRKLAGLSDQQVVSGMFRPRLRCDDTAESLLAGYERACAASRQAASRFSLGSPP